MKAIQHQGKLGLEGLSYGEMEEPSVKKGMVKIQLKAAGMNRRDLAVTSRHKEDQPALVLGSDGAGIITDIGDDVTRFEIGDEVVINPGIGWKEKSDAPPKGFEIVGLPGNGTFSEYYAVSEDYVEKKPEHLSWEEAGVLPLAALTAYRVLFSRANITENDTVMLPGIGSGVLTYALKFAKAIGARVIVTSRSEEKQEAALNLGADVAIDTHSDWNDELKHETVDVLVESIGGATFDQSLSIIRKGGTIVTFGATTEDEVKIDIRKFFYGQFNLLGSTMGSREEFQHMLHFVKTHNIKPELDHMFKLSEYAQAFTYLRDSKNFGKIGFTIHS